MIDEKLTKFFLGSNTKRGFVPLFDQLTNPSEDGLYILKGGPGSGKSSLMRRIIKDLEEVDHIIEYIHCASDPSSLDAFIDYDLDVSMVDGTSPHVIDPAYPGAYDMIINLGDVWDSDILKNNKKDIIALSNIISKCHKMATANIASAAALLDNNMVLAKPFVNEAIIKKYARLLYEELKASPKGSERKRLLSAVSVGKTVFFDDTLSVMCSKVYGIFDKWGAASNMLLSQLHSFAIYNELDVITCYCSVRTPDKIDHLIFPSANIGISTVNTFHATKHKELITIDGLMNNIDKTLIDGMKDNLSAAVMLIETAGRHIAKAKSLHDELEAYYVKAMDFSKVNVIYDNIIREILTD